jgi:hypothetical protein
MILLILIFIFLDRRGNTRYSEQNGSKRFPLNVVELELVRDLRFFTMIQIHVMAFWIWIPYNDELGCQRFGVPCCLHFQVEGRMVGAYYILTRRHIPEDLDLIVVAFNNITVRKLHMHYIVHPCVLNTVLLL